MHVQTRTKPSLMDPQGAVVQGIAQSAKLTGRSLRNNKLQKDHTVVSDIFEGEECVHLYENSIGDLRVALG